MFNLTKGTSVLITADLNGYFSWTVSGLEDMSISGVAPNKEDLKISVEAALLAWNTYTQEVSKRTKPEEDKEHLWTKLQNLHWMWNELTWQQQRNVADALRLTAITGRITDLYGYMSKEATLSGCFVEHIEELIKDKIILFYPTHASLKA